MKIELDNEILKGAIDTFGTGAQIDMAVEECSELINALMKLRRSRVVESRLMVLHRTTGEIELFKKEHA